MFNLLFIDDDTDVLAVNKRYFTKEGYQVKAAVNAISGLRLLKGFQADCILLDVMMPDMDGFTAIHKIKDLSMAPVIFLTGKTFEEDKIKGLLSGADDYVIKPYSLRELSARIKVQIRRAQGSLKNRNILEYPPLSLELIKHKAFYNEEEIPLSNREYELLYLLASKPNQEINYSDIGNYLWGSYSDTDRRTIMVIASRLRKKLEAYVGLSEMIETVWSKGYKFILKYRERVNE